MWKPEDDNGCLPPLFDTWFFNTRPFTKTVSCLSGCGESEPQVLMLSRQAHHLPKHEVLPSSNTEQLTVFSAVSKRKKGEESASEKAN